MLAPVSAAEKTEIILAYLGVMVAKMSTETLGIFRTRCVEMGCHKGDQGAVIEVIDWLLALREAGADFSGR